MEFPGSEPSWSQFHSELQNRLLDARTLVLNEELTSTVTARLSEQLAVMDAQSEEPVQVLVSSVPGGDVEAGLSLHDLLQSMTAPVTVLGTGHIVGAGVLAVVATPIERRFALPHVHFRLEESKSRLEGKGQDLESEAEEVVQRRRRVVEILSEATGQPPEQVSADLSERRTLDAEAAIEYGLIHRVVESRNEID